MSSTSDSNVLGVVVLVRHGDRQGFYQTPDSYTASLTAITPLGNAQELQLGQFLRSLYINTTSPSYIQGINTTLFDQTQVAMTADGGGEAGVILDSAVSLAAGLFPPTSLNSDTLANGANITAPFSGYQTVPIAVVNPNNDVSFEGFTDCNTFTTWTTDFYNTSAFQAVAAANAGFLNNLTQYLDGRAVTLSNMWNIFDFMNVNDIHNAAFAAALPPTYLAQARALANYHEYGVFSSPQMNGIGNIAGRTLLPNIIEGIQNVANSSNPLKLVVDALAYKPFLSLFNMTGVAAANPELAGIVNYAAAVALEVRQNTTGGTNTTFIRFQFKNGTDDPGFNTYSFLNGSSDVDVDTFINALYPAAINSTTQWCNACSNTVDRGCAAITEAKTAALATVKHDKISPVGAGFLGAGLALVVVALSLLGLFFLGLLACGRASRKKDRHLHDDHDETKA